MSENIKNVGPYIGYETLDGSTPSITLTEFKQIVLEAVDEGKYITEKHNAYDMTESLVNQKKFTRKRRSVLSAELSDPEILKQFIVEGNYRVEEYENTNPNHTPYYWVVKPNSGSTYSIPGSGVPPYSDQPDVPNSLMITVSGYNQGVHGFAEDDQELNNKVNDGKLIFKGELRD